MELTGDCVEWDKYRDPKGYGRRKFRGKTWRAHRVAWVEANGEIPDGLHVLHRCDNPPCVNPEHLFLGTDQDNMADKVAKGRQSKGESNGRAKLTETEVRAIRADTRTHQAIANDYGITRFHVSKIKSRHEWAHVT